MSAESPLALIGLAVSMTWGPGPNNTLLSASGANYGWRRSVPHVLGVTFGFPAMLVAVTLGLGQALRAFPAVLQALSWVGLAVVLWFAWRIATAGTGSGSDRRRPLSFVEAIGFQWVNPKAWALALYVATTYGAGPIALPNLSMAVLAFLVSGFASSSTWALFGLAIGRLLDRGWRLRVFNVAMAGLLVASSVWLFLRN